MSDTDKSLHCMATFAEADASSGYLFAWNAGNDDWNNFYIHVERYGQRIAKRDWSAETPRKHTKPPADIFAAACQAIVEREPKLAGS